MRDFVLQANRHFSEPTFQHKSHIIINFTSNPQSKAKKNSRHPRPIHLKNRIPPKEIRWSSRRDHPPFRLPFEDDRLSSWARGVGECADGGGFICLEAFEES